MTSKVGELVEMIVGELILFLVFVPRVLLAVSAHNCCSNDRGGDAGLSGGDGVFGEDESVVDCDDELLRTGVVDDNVGERGYNEFLNANVTLYGELDVSNSTGDECKIVACAYACVNNAVLTTFTSPGLINKIRSYNLLNNLSTIS